jgi:hypothetical protein
VKIFFHSIIAWNFCKLLERVAVSYLYRLYGNKAMMYKKPMKKKERNELVVSS